MHTLLTLAVGFVLLGLALGLVRVLGPQSPRTRVRAMALFVLLWGMLCAINVAKGLTAGFTVETEALAFAITFGLPTAVAILLSRKSSTP